MWPWTEWWGLALAVAAWTLTAGAIFIVALFAAEATKRRDGRRWLTVVAAASGGGAWTWAMAGGRPMAWVIYAAAVGSLALATWLDASPGAADETGR